MNKGKKGGKGETDNPMGVLRRCQVWTVFTFSTFLTLLPLSTGWAATGLAWLHLGQSPRAMGLGGAYTAVGLDSAALFANPAGPAALMHADLFLQHSTWIEQTTFDTISLAIPSALGTIGGGAFWLTTPGLERRGMNRELLGTFQTSSWAGFLSWSATFQQDFSLGLNLKLVGETLDDLTMTGFAVDLGALWHTPVDHLTVGVALQHFGPALTYFHEATPLPTTITVGLAYPTSFGLLLAADLRYEPGMRQTTMQVGTELTTFGLLALRLGYSAHALMGASTISVGNLSIPTGLVGGLGLTVQGMTLDYAVVPVSPFGLTHRLGLQTIW